MLGFVFFGLVAFVFFGLVDLVVFGPVGRTALVVLVVKLVGFSRSSSSS
ncbi:MAG: hypothetical protein JO147_05900 [Actinobacteria bacterium]|nr:hypothetical protein [Actinomycetota bacterium]